MIKDDVRSGETRSVETKKTSNTYYNITALKLFVFCFVFCFKGMTLRNQLKEEKLKRS